MKHRNFRIAWSVAWGLLAVLQFVLLAAVAGCAPSKSSSNPTFEVVVPIAGNTAILADEIPSIDRLAKVDTTLEPRNPGDSVPRPLAKEKWGSLIEVFRSTQAVKVHQSLSLTGNLELVQSDGKSCEVWIYSGEPGQVIFMPHEGGRQAGDYYATQITDDPIWSDLPIFDSRPRPNIRLRVTVVMLSVAGAIAWVFTRKRFTLRDMFCAVAVLSCAAGLALYFLDK